MTTDKALVGNAGEHYVAYQLSEREYAVGLTARGTEGIDLLAANPKTGKSIAIQVKTTRNAYDFNKSGEEWWKWRISEKSVARQPEKTFFWIFVDLRRGSGKPPDIFIVPSSNLKRDMRSDYPGWYYLEKDNASKFKNSWDLIEDALA